MGHRRKCFAAFLLLAAVVGLAACGGSAFTAASEQDGATTDAPTGQDSAADSGTVGDATTDSRVDRDTGSAGDSTLPNDAVVQDVVTSDVVPLDTGSADDSGTGSVDSAAPDGANGCPLTVDDDAGIFVRQNSPDAGLTCGTRATPCSNIDQGIKAAQAASKTIIYVSPGTYEESLFLVAGQTIQGGWVVTGGTVWTEDCTNSAQSSDVVVRGTNAIDAMGLNVIATATQGASITLSTLTLARQQSQVNAGESVVGLLVGGTASSVAVSLENVVIAMPNAGDGVAGAQGGMGASGAACTVASTSPPQPGQSGAPGTAAGATTASGTEYLPGNGQAGLPGLPGGNGEVMTARQCCGTCGINLSLACAFTPGSTCGQPAPLPCGGGGGAPGGGGSAGGSSIGILVLDNGSVNIDAGSVAVGDGGAGGAGGSGGMGGPASGGGPGGNMGPSAMCPAGAGTACSGACLPMGPSAAGGVDTPAASGGAGGGGSGGAGGNSIAIASAGSGTVTGAPATPPAVGQPGIGGPGGSGASNGPNGIAQATISYP